MNWTEIKRLEGQLSTADDAAHLHNGDKLELEITRIEWYEDPVGRPAAFVQVRLADGKLFKAPLYIPEGTKVRRLEEG